MCKPRYYLTLTQQLPPALASWLRLNAECIHLQARWKCLLCHPHSKACSIPRLACDRALVCDVAHEKWHLECVSPQRRGAVIEEAVVPVNDGKGVCGLVAPGVVVR